MKRTLVALGLIVLLSPKPTLAAFVEFNPKNAQFVSPDKIKKPAAPKVVTKPAVQGVAVVNESYIKNVVTGTINDMIAQGLLKGQKGDKGDSAAMPNLGSYNPDAVGFQQVYLPGAVIGPDVGTFFSATNLSSDNITSGSASLGDIDSDGNLTVAGNVDLQGSTSIATGSIASLNVGSLTSNSGAYLSDGGDWVNASSKELKENFATTSPQDILRRIDALPIYTWNYKAQNASTTHIGPVAEDFHQTFGLGGEGGDKAISTIDPAGIALAGIQGLNQKLNQMFDFSWILDGLKKLGIEITDGIVKAKQIVVDLVQTKSLEVGSSDQPTGIIIFDRATGQPVCIYSENNMLKSESGKCQSGLLSQAPEQAPAADPQLENATSSPETSATTTPESAAITMPDLTLSNP